MDTASNKTNLNARNDSEACAPIALIHGVHASFISHVVLATP